MAENAELLVLQGSNEFTNNLYKILAEQDGNIFFSPISIHVVLSMAYQGAQSTTAERFAETLKIPQDKTAAEGYNAVMKRLNSLENVTLLMANKLYLMDGDTLVKNFKTAIIKQFLSDVQLIDFGQNKLAAKTINDWIKEKTHGKIKDVISKDDLTGLTKLVLVNTIYFKGNWKLPFDKRKTNTETFYLNNNDKTKVKMMHIRENFYCKYESSLEAGILELQYDKVNLSMFIILPHERNGINKVEQKLCGINLTDITREMDIAVMEVSLPRFKIEATIDLQNSLTKIGLGEIFDPVNANFKGMFEKPRGNLHVSKVIQKAFIEVNEEGTEAAAATVGREIFMCGPEEFKVNHPFIFILAENRNNPLFIGRIANPNKCK